MSLAAALPVSTIDDAVTKAMEHVFRTMIGHQVKLVQKIEDHGMLVVNDPQVIGSVGFLGSANGLIYLRFPEPYAVLATSRILDMSLNEVEMNGPEVVKDAIGELTNMTVGGFKNQICDLGFPCKLTLPTIVRGNNIAVAAVKSATRHIFHFEAEGHRIIADLQVKLEA